MYDRFPHLLGGEVDGAMREDGRVQTKNYGKGFWFAPVKILPFAQGRALLDELEALAKEYEHASDALNREFRRRALEVMDAQTTRRKRS